MVLSQCVVRRDAPYMALLSQLPARIAEGWPQQFEYWKCALIEAGARVEIDWDWT